MKIETRWVGHRKVWNGSECILIHPTANLIGEVHAGHNTRIDGHVTIVGPVRIGRNCHIGSGVSIFGGAGVTIGDHCALSSGVRVFTMSVDPSDDLLALHGESELDRGGGVSGPVEIGSYTTIGANSVILPGVQIGREAVIGALSVVRSDIGDRWVAVGAPARYVRLRKPLRYLGSDEHEAGNEGKVW